VAYSIKKLFLLYQPPTPSGSATAAILPCCYRYWNILILSPKPPGKPIETQACAALFTPHFPTLLFFEEGKGKWICVIQKFWSVFFLLVFNELQILSGDTVIQEKKNLFWAAYSKKKRIE
jgi:hypothetical protein